MRGRGRRSSGSWGVRDSKPGISNSKTAKRVTSNRVEGEDSHPRLCARMHVHEGHCPVRRKSWFVNLKISNKSGEKAASQGNECFLAGGREAQKPEPNDVACAPRRTG